MSKPIKMLLLAEKISDRVAIFARLYKHQNFTTVLLYSTDPNNLIHFLDDHLSFKYQDIATLNKILSGLDNDTLIHYFNFSPDNTGHLLLNSKRRYIYDYKDIFTNLRKHEIGPNSRKLEYLLIRNSLFVTSRDLQASAYVARLNSDSKFLLREFFIPDYNFQDHARGIGGLGIEAENHVRQSPEQCKLICTGGVSSDRADCIDASGLSNLVNIVVRNENLSLDIIGDYANHSTGDLGIDLRCERVRRIPQMSRDKFHLALWQYDFAVHASNADLGKYDADIEGCYEYDSVKYFSSARCFSYASSGLPMVIGESQKWNINFFSRLTPVIQVNRLNSYQVFSNLSEMKHLRFLAINARFNFFCQNIERLFSDEYLAFINDAIQ